MSKRRGIWGIGLPLSAVLEWCKRMADRYWRGARGISWSVADGGRNDQFEVARLTNIRAPEQVDFCGERIELKEFIEGLSVGDRIRVLCDDGVLVAEKISRTEFKLIHSQMMAKFVH